MTFCGYNLQPDVVDVTGIFGKMRCQACDCLLSDFEATRKNLETREFVDLCNKCFQEVAECVDTLVADERYDLEGIDHGKES